IRVENSQTTRPLPPIEYHYFVDKDQRHNPLFFIAEEEARLAAIRSTLRTGRSNNSPTVQPHPFNPIQPSSGNAGGSGGGRDPKLEDMERQRPTVHFVWRISELPTGCSTCTGEFLVELNTPNLKEDLGILKLTKLCEALIFCVGSCLA
ncbi:hypothetical protein AHF37_11873, partial [Paragonimus kellicotti]